MKVLIDGPLRPKRPAWGVCAEPHMTLKSGECVPRRSGQVSAAWQLVPTRGHRCECSPRCTAHVLMSKGRQQTHRCSGMTLMQNEHCQMSAVGAYARTEVERRSGRIETEQVILIHPRKIKR